MKSLQKLKASGIGKRYGNFTALDDIHLDIEQGEFLTLLGPSGSGKTTLLMILAGFLLPESGQIIRGGVDITRLPAEKRNFGMVFQGYALFPHMTVAQNVDFPLRLRGMKTDERRRRVERILDVVGLASHMHKKPSQLSGGQQQRVAIARALVFEPELLLLDEPLSALDKNLREQLQSELQRIHREVGTSFVFVTHDQSEALALSTRIAVFNQGRLIQVDTPEKIYQRPLCRFAAEFIGKMNLFNFTGAVQNGSTYTARINGSTVYASSDRVLSGTELTLAVRPEQMNVVPAPVCDPGYNCVPVRVVERVYQGSTTLLKMLTEDDVHVQFALSSQDGVQPPGSGERLYLTWPISAGILLPA
jgi:putative spermidine/putrescine transport system ATP-binding protein